MRISGTSDTIMYHNPFGWTPLEIENELDPSVRMSMVQDNIKNGMAPGVQMGPLPHIAPGSPMKLLPYALGVGAVLLLGFLVLGRG